MLSQKAGLYFHLVGDILTHPTKTSALIAVLLSNSNKNKIVTIYHTFTVLQKCQKHLMRFTFVNELT